MATGGGIWVAAGGIGNALFAGGKVEFSLSHLSPIYSGGKIDSYFDWVGKPDGGGTFVGEADHVPFIRGSLRAGDFGRTAVHELHHVWQQRVLPGFSFYVHNLFHGLINPGQSTNFFETQAWEEYWFSSY
jgi:hypothetical protein